MKRAKGPSSYFSLSAKGSAGGGEKGGGGVVDDDGDDDDDEVEVTDSESSATARAESRWAFGRCGRERAKVFEGVLEETEPQRPLQLLAGTRGAEETGVVGESIVSIGKKVDSKKKRTRVKNAGWMLPNEVDSDQSV